MGQRFQVGWMRLSEPLHISPKVCELGLISAIVPFIGYHHVLMIIIAISIILLCRSLAYIPII